MTDKAKQLLAAKKALGTVNKIIAMIEENRYCPEIIQQIDSATGLLAATRKELLKGHFMHCLEHKMAEDKDSTIAELMKLYKLNN